MGSCNCGLCPFLPLEIFLFCFPFLEPCSLSPLCTNLTWSLRVSSKASCSVKFPQTFNCQPFAVPVMRFFILPAFRRATFINLSREKLQIWRLIIIIIIPVPTYFVPDTLVDFLGDLSCFDKVYRLKPTT